MVDREEQLMRGKFDGILIDPFNELDIDLGGGKTMSTVKNELDALLWWTKQKNYFTLLTNHVNDKAEVRATDHNGQTFFWTPPAKKEEWAYGQQFGRKGYQMILIHKPADKMIDAEGLQGDKEAEHAMQNFYNMREFYVQKTKPKGVGKTGKFRLFFDRKLQRYYCLNLEGEKQQIRMPKI